MTYREIKDAVGLVNIKSAEARVRRSKWEKRLRAGTSAVEVFIPEGELKPHREMPAKREPRHRNLWPQEMSEIIAKHAAGATARSLADEYNCHFTTIYRVLQSAKAQPNAAPVRATGESSIDFARRCRKWKMENDPEFLAAYRAKMKRAQKRVAWRKKRLKEIAAMEAAKEAERVALGSPDTNNAHVDEPPVQMQQPTLWQRWFGWVRW